MLFCKLSKQYSLRDLVLNLSLRLIFFTIW
ncbi:MAG: hypothetical protein DRP26_01715 [Candidatus Zixiibacteriota bacterium]|nr:MAG: hypothetical protein DRP26_01715 [candidate division Zixibacteria bacterium]